MMLCRRACIRLNWRAYSTSKSSCAKRINQELKSRPNVNPVGIQQLDESMRKVVFGASNRKPSEELLHLAERHLFTHGLLGKKTSISEPVTFPVPKLHGKSLDEHFYKIGTESSEPYRTKALNLANVNVPEPPSSSEWVHQSGWTRYERGKPPQSVPMPLEDQLVFDVEVLYKHSDYAVMATAVSPNAWYAWISPWILGESDKPEHLIPVADPKSQAVIVGHNVGYDRKRVKEEYHIGGTTNFYLDTMSLHIAVNGMCSQQRPKWMKMNKLRKKEQESEEFSDEMEENPWFVHSSLNSLADVARLHCGIEVDKSARDLFGELDQHQVREQLNELLTYCATDVVVTHKVYQKVLPSFLNVCPHPVSFAGFRHISNLFLPINQQWEKYLKSAEACYEEATEIIRTRLVQLAEEAVKLKDQPEVFQNDPWLSQLDWTIKPVRMVKSKKKGEPDRPAARQKLPGMPEWYKSLFPTANSEMKISIRGRIAPILLRLQWDGNPLLWTDTYGWIFRVHVDNAPKYQKLNYSRCDMNDQDLRFRDDKYGAYFRVPHKDGPSARCTNPMAKTYVHYFDQGVLYSEYDYAKQAIALNVQLSYWIAARDRINNQMPVYSDVVDMGVPVTPGNPKEFGMIVPRTIPMGTITRRAVEDTWMTASNAKKNRIGSELKAMIQAPPGYAFVGADVDSEELWIASLIGDSQFGIHGGTAIGWMTLEGSKKEGSDMHSKTASILNISRNEAKIFNYGRIYGAGLKFAVTLLRQFNPLVSNEEATGTATNLYEATKGKRKKSSVFGGKQVWYGGTESVVFNRLEEMAEHDTPRTPILGASITEALMKGNLGPSYFLPSRINWSIQSSGVDYLHLLTTSMEYLIKRYGLRARLSITVHDEIRYLAKEEDKYKVALALQISNLWTRAMFCQQVGIDNVPQSCAFFSLVDIDRVMRKEVDLDCVTPSHPEAIPPGESITIQQLLEKVPLLKEPEHASAETKEWLQKIEATKYSPRASVVSSLGNNEHLTQYLQAQVTTDSKEFRKMERSVRKTRKDQSFDIMGTSHMPPWQRSTNSDHGNPLATISKKRRPTVTDIEIHEILNQPDWYKMKDNPVIDIRSDTQRRPVR